MHAFGEMRRGHPHDIGRASEVGMGDQMVFGRRGRVVTMTMARPAKKNALTLEMYRAMTAALLKAQADDEVRVVFWSGSEGCFTSGNDLRDFANPDADLSAVLDFLNALRGLTKPLVVAVSGLAIGIGTTALLHADLVYAAPSAKFKLPFVDLGLVPEAASSFLLPAAIGPARASRMLLMGETIDAATAERWGLISQLWSDGSVEDFGLAQAERLAARAPQAVRKTKALMKRWEADRVARIQDIEAEIFEACLRGPETAEALRAFAEKRQPSFD